VEQAMRVIELLQRIYQRHAAGCCLHIVTDDGNIETEHVEWSRDYARKQGHVDCVEAAELLLQMSEEDRKNIYHRYSEYCA
jgi:hypothetical protein